MSYRYYKGFRQQKRPKTHLRSSAIMPFNSPLYNFLFVLHCIYVSILHRFRDFISYFRKFKDVMYSSRDSLYPQC